MLVVIPMILHLPVGLHELH